jgi:hypothetical protein
MNTDFMAESLRSNPFALLMNPQAVLEAVERSERLSGLNRHLCRPLDRPVIPASGASNDAALMSDDDGGDDGQSSTALSEEPTACAANAC